jgi:Cu(I)/Ag(I) efflux system membrane fusion protein
MRRMREQLGVMPEHEAHVELIMVPPEFQVDLARIWEQYLAVWQALAADNLPNAQESLARFEAAVSTVSDQPPAGRSKEVWAVERTNLLKLIERLKKAQDIQAVRTEFSTLSQEIGVLAKAFGFGDASPIYELHCPMAFQGQGAIWYQDSDQVRNPYFGSTMLTCADRVDRVVLDEAPIHGQLEAHENHSQH